MEDFFAVFETNPYMEPVLIVLAALIFGWIFSKAYSKTAEENVEEDQMEGR